MTTTKRFATGYMDNATTPEGLSQIVETAIRDLGEVDFDTIVGTGFSGGVVIPFLAAAMGKDFVLIRKEDDDSHHGPGKLLGTLGQRWIFVDDFVSSGATQKRVLAKVEEAAAPSTEFWGDKTDLQTTYVGTYTYVNFDKKGWRPNGVEQPAEPGQHEEN